MEFQVSFIQISLNDAVGGGLKGGWNIFTPTPYNHFLSKWFPCFILSIANVGALFDVIVTGT